jgi:hypothetical protein
VEYGGCGPTVAPFLARNYYGKKAEWVAALSWCRNPPHMAPPIGSFSPQNIWIEMLGHSFTLGKEFIMHNSVNPPHRKHALQCGLLRAPVFPYRTRKPKTALKGRKSDDVITIQRQSQGILTEYKTQDFCTCFEQQREHWTLCIKSQGNYFEGKQHGKASKCNYLREKYIIKKFFITPRIQSKMCRQITPKSINQSIHTNKS